MSPSRRRVLRYSAAGVALGLAGCSSSDDPPVADTPTDSGSTDTTPTVSRGQTVQLQRVASGFTAPLGFESVPGRDGEWVVVDQDGRVWYYDGAAIRDQPLLDVRERMVDINPGYDERGLLGLAFHPEFATNGKLYARYSAPSREGTPDSFSHTFVLSEFVVDGRQADPSTERTLLEIPEPQGNHNAGSVTFGPDGYCYVGVGDGGGAGDSGSGHVTDWYDGVPGGNGQDITENLLGSVLRIDVDVEDGYGVPEGNPLVGSEGLDEQYAWGFRNPWRMSFDGSDLYVADVGQNNYEEVSLVRAGGNYGWNVREAAHCYDADSCPTKSPRGTDLVDPIIEYDHGGEPPNGVSVIGGYRYRGSTMAPLQGAYLFCDWRFGGSLFAAEPTDSGQWSVSVMNAERQGSGSLGSQALSFGRDADDELYLCTTDRSGPGGDTGEVYKLVGMA